MGLREEIADRSLALTSENLRSFDCVIVVTGHRAFDYDLIPRGSLPIIGCRNVLPKGTTNVVRI